MFSIVALFVSTPSTFAVNPFIIDKFMSVTSLTGLPPQHFAHET